MQTNQEPVSPLERRIELAVPLADIDKNVEQRLKKMARTVKMPGFRPGKVPFKIVVQQYGDQARSEATGEAVERAFGNLVREQNIRVAGYPRIEPKRKEDGAPAEGKFEFSAVFEVYPEIKLGDISTKAIERPVLAVSEVEVDKTIEVLRKQRTLFVESQLAAVNGDRVTIDFTGRMNGEVFNGGQANDYPMMLGAGGMLPDFEKPIEGMKTGESKTFDMTFPADYQSTDLAGKQVSFEVVVKRIEAPQLPEVNADFAKALGIENGDLVQMRVEVKANLEREVTKRIKAKVKEQAMNAMLDANPIEIPTALVQQEAKALAEEARKDLTNRGIDAKNVPIEPAWFAEQATRRVKLGLIISEVVKANGLHAKPDQLKALVEEFAQSYENPAEVVRWYYSQPERLAQIEALAIEENVVHWVVANTKTSDKPVPFDELMGNAA